MRKTITTAALTGVIGVAAVAVAGTASAAPASLSAQDRAFMQSNQQGNLAEVSIGQLALGRAQFPATRALADKTISDHQRLSGELTALAARDGVSLPSAPNAEQQQLAAALRSISPAAFDRSYDAGQIVAHRQALAGDLAELMSGSDSAVKSYARDYQVTATPHLTMAIADLAALTGSAPSAVVAGSGGLVATNRGSSDGALAGLAGGLVLMAGSGTLLARRRRRRARAGAAG